MSSEFPLEKTSNLTKKLLFGIIVGILLYISFIFFGDITKIKAIVSSIPLYIYLISIVSVLIGYAVRSLKWQYSLNKLNIKIPYSNSLDIFFIGTALAISPGKLGELIKSFILKKKYGVEISRSVPLIFADHLTTLFAWLIFISLGISVLPFGYIPFILLCLTILILIFVIQNKRFTLKILNKITNLRVFKKHKIKIMTFFEGILLLLSFKILLVTTALSLISCFTECIPLYLIINTLDINLNLIQCIFVVGLGTVAGTLSLMPGGLGVAEGSVIGMLIFFDINKSIAISISLLERLVVLWLGVSIGLVVLFIKRKKYLF
jgi:uncharacterized protein (TIRG00374 family)